MKTIVRIDGQEQSVAQLETIGYRLGKRCQSKLTLKAIHVSRDGHQPTVNIELTYGGVVVESG